MHMQVWATVFYIKYLWKLHSLCCLSAIWQGEKKVSDGLTCLSFKGSACGDGKWGEFFKLTATSSPVTSFITRGSVLTSCTDRWYYRRDEATTTQLHFQLFGEYSFDSMNTDVAVCCLALTLVFSNGSHSVICKVFLSKCMWMQKAKPGQIKSHNYPQCTCAHLNPFWIVDHYKSSLYIDTV